MIRRIPEKLWLRALVPLNKGFNNFQIIIIEKNKIVQRL